MLRREDTLQSRQAEEEVREAGVASPRDGDAETRGSSRQFSLSKSLRGADVLVKYSCVAKATVSTNEGASLTTKAATHNLHPTRRASRLGEAVLSPRKTVRR